MAKIRMEITKGDEIRFIAHLDYARTIERAVRRAKLPAAYSEGFNPHMKLAFASALGVGVASQAEYVDIELREEVKVESVLQDLGNQLPPSIVLKRGKYIPSSSAALMAIVNLAEYRVQAPVVASVDPKAIEVSIQQFNEANEVQFVRQSPKGRREMNVKEFVKKVDFSLLENRLQIYFPCSITPQGTIKPSEVIGAMVGSFGLKIDKDSILINRTGLFIAKEGSVRRTPLEIF